MQSSLIGKFYKGINTGHRCQCLSGRSALWGMQLSIDYHADISQKRIICTLSLSTGSLGSRLGRFNRKVLIDQRRVRLRWLFLSHTYQYRRLSYCTRSLAYKRDIFPMQCTRDICQHIFSKFWFKLFRKICRGKFDCMCFNLSSSTHRGRRDRSFD